jgi:FKBP-type peptidyl-prolyl cis-trans isomerase FkpA
MHHPETANPANPETQPLKPTHAHPFRRAARPVRRVFSIAVLLGGLALTGTAHADDPLKQAAAEKGAVVSESGLVFLSLREGSGASPVATDTVKVNYRGTFTDGREFDSSYKRGEPASFPLNRVIKCWTEGVQKLKVGGKAKLTCPSAIAYGDRGAGNGQIPGGATLVFEVELLAVNGK